MDELLASVFDAVALSGDGGCSLEQAAARARAEAGVLPFLARVVLARRGRQCGVMVYEVLGEDPLTPDQVAKTLSEQQKKERKRPSGTGNDPDDEGVRHVLSFDEKSGTVFLRRMREVPETASLLPSDLLPSDVVEGGEGTAAGEEASAGHEAGAGSGRRHVLAPSPRLQASCFRCRPHEWSDIINVYDRLVLALVARRGATGAEVSVLSKLVGAKGNHLSSIIYKLEARLLLHRVAVTMLKREAKRDSKEKHSLTNTVVLRRFIEDRRRQRQQKQQQHFQEGRRAEGADASGDAAGEDEDGDEGPVRALDVHDDKPSPAPLEFDPNNASYFTRRMINVLRENGGTMSLRQLRKTTYDGADKSITSGMLDRTYRGLFTKIRDKLVKNGVVDIGNVDCKERVNGERTSVLCLQLRDASLHKFEEDAVKAETKPGALSGWRPHPTLAKVEAATGEAVDQDRDGPGVPPARGGREEEDAGAGSGQRSAESAPDGPAAPYIGLSKYEAAYRTLRHSGSDGMHLMELMGNVSTTLCTYRPAQEFLAQLQLRYQLEFSKVIKNKNITTLIQVPEAAMAEALFDETLLDEFGALSGEDPSSVPGSHRTGSAAGGGAGGERRIPASSPECPEASGLLKPNDGPLLMARTARIDIGGIKQSQASLFFRGDIKQNRKERVMRHLREKEFILYADLGSLILSGDPPGSKRMDFKTLRRFVIELEKGGEARMGRFESESVNKTTGSRPAPFEVLLHESVTDIEDCRMELEEAVNLYKQRRVQAMRVTEAPLLNVDPSLAKAIASYREPRQIQSDGHKRNTGICGPMRRASILHQLLGRLLRKSSAADGEQGPAPTMAPPDSEDRPASVFAAGPKIGRACECAVKPSSVFLEQFVGDMSVENFLLLNLADSRDTMEGFEDQQMKIRDLPGDVSGSCVNGYIYRSRLLPVIDVLASLGLARCTGVTTKAEAPGGSGEAAGGAGVAGTESYQTVIHVMRTGCIETADATIHSLIPAHVRSTPMSQVGGAGGAVQTHVCYDFALEDHIRDYWLVLESVGRVHANGYTASELSKIFPLKACRIAMAKTKWKGSRAISHLEIQRLRSAISKDTDILGTDDEAALRAYLLQVSNAQGIDLYRVHEIFRSERVSFMDRVAAGRRVRRARSDDQGKRKAPPSRLPQEQPKRKKGMPDAAQSAALKRKAGGMEGARATAVKMKRVSTTAGATKDRSGHVGGSTPVVGAGRLGAHCDGVGAGTDGLDFADRGQRMLLRAGMKTAWTEEDDRRLLRAVRTYNESNPKSRTNAPSFRRHTYAHARAHTNVERKASAADTHALDSACARLLTFHARDTFRLCAHCANPQTMNYDELMTEIMRRALPARLGPDSGPASVSVLLRVAV